MPRPLDLESGGPPRIAVVVAGTVVLALVVMLSVPKLRAPAIDRARVVIGQLVPRLLTFAQNPWRLAAALGGQVLVVLFLLAGTCLP